MYTLTLQDVKSCFNTKPERIALFFPFLQETCTKYQINTPNRIAAFFAQVAIESCDLQYTHEIASGDTYTTRQDLENTLPEAITAYKAAVARGFKGTLGAFYKGAGLIQITGFINYKEISQVFGIDAINHPELLQEPEWACKSAGWFWNTKNLNSLADVGEFGKITKRINGGYNQAEERLKRYVINKKVLGAT